MNDTILHGKTALVTGASSGLGVDCARNLAGRGCNLILAARREERLRAVYATYTEFLQVAGQQPSLYQRLVMMNSADVTRIGIANMLNGKPSVVPGWLNAVTVWFNRLVPRRLSAALAYRLMTVR